MEGPHSVYPLTYQWAFSCFCFSETVTIAAVDVCVCKCLWGHVFSLLLGLYREVELLGHMATRCLTLQNNQIFLQATKPVYILIRSVGTSLAVQWLRLGTPNARGTGTIPGQGIKIPALGSPKIKKKKKIYSQYVPISLHPRQPLIVFIFLKIVIPVCEKSLFYRWGS